MSREHAQTWSAQGATAVSAQKGLERAPASMTSEIRTTGPVHSCNNSSFMEMEIQHILLGCWVAFGRNNGMQLQPWTTPIRQEQCRRGLCRCRISQPSILCDPNGGIGQSAKPDSAGPRRSVPHTAQPPMAKRRKKPNGWRLCKPELQWLQWLLQGLQWLALFATGSPTAQTRSENTIFVQTRGDPGSDGVQRPGPPGLAWLPDGFPGLPWTWPPEPVFWMFGWARTGCATGAPEHGTRHPARWSSELAWPIERA